jgi:hypothetical protein
MDKSEIKKSILRTVEAELDAWLELEPNITDAFEYEKSLFERTMKIGHTILVESKGKQSKDRNTKKKCIRYLAR